MTKLINLVCLFVGAICCVAQGAVKNQEHYKFMNLTINDGLSNNQVMAIVKDRQGFMWFGTNRGLNRYDGTNLKVYRHDPFDEHTIPFNSVSSLFEDQDGTLWVRSLTRFVLFDPVKESFSQLPQFYRDSEIPLNGILSVAIDQNRKTWLVNPYHALYSYDYATGKSDSITLDSGELGLQSGDIIDGIAFDSDNNLWGVSRDFKVFKFDVAQRKLLKLMELFPSGEVENTSSNLYIDSDDEVWIWAPGQPFGTFQLSGEGEIIRHLMNSREQGGQLNSSLVSSVIEEKKGKIWIASDHGGINVLDKETGQVISLVANSEDQYSLAQNSVTYLYRDDRGMIWAGTYKQGLSFYHPYLIQFQHYKSMASQKNSLPYDDVNCFVEDAKGNLWIGTNGGGLIYFDRKANRYTTYKHDPDKPKSLSSNVIVALYIDRNSQLWIGSYFGGLDRFDGQEFHHHTHDPNDPGSLSDNRVWEIYEDSKRNLWVGTLAGGLNLYDHERELFYHYRSGEVNSVGADFIRCIIEDSNNNLWIGTSAGIDRLNLETRRFFHYAANSGVEGYLSDSNALDLLEDSRGYLWIATSEGLNVMDRHSDQFRVFNEEDGLEDSNIKTLQEDQKGNLWISTTHGISRIEVIETGDSHNIKDLKIQVMNYDLMDGLQGKEFNEKAAYRTKKGELVFGGGNGFNLFVPEDIQKVTPENKLVLTGLKVYNQEVKVGVPINKRVILKSAINDQQSIRLKASENVFSIGFSAINYFHPEKNSYQYQLEGLSDEWLDVDPKNLEATFTNLNAGEYVFRVRVRSVDPQWKQLSTPLTIEVLPPFWRSKWAMLLYGVLLLVILYFTRRFMLERQRLKFEAEQEHREAERIQQLDTLKTKFFTNISHEFRTPLTLIMAPLEKLIIRTEDEKSRNQLVFIHRQSRRLLAMVNQLLDFRKMELQKIQAKRSWGDLMNFIEELGVAFQDMADNKQMKLDVAVTPDSFYTFFDQDKTYKIIANLLSNAFKFTPDKGVVSLRAEIEGEAFQLNAHAHVWLRVEVEDTGIGIPEDKREKIFDRFYQDELPSSIVNQGSGIGLSMVSEYVHILDGTVAVDSALGKGTTFTIRIPVQLMSASEIALHNREQEQQEEMKFFVESGTAEEKEEVFDSSKRSILLVEDNDDFRFYLKDNLREKYNIFEARNGKLGWEKCLKHMPDLVVSDVMMPEMTGTELCKKIKSDGRSSHLPVILLTAKVETEDKLEGLESGADDYIAKPFDFRILESRIENLISSREALRQTYQTMIGLNPEKIQVTSVDEKFMKKALEIVEENISNSDFTVEDLSKEVGMSRVSLYKKLLALTKKTPVEFIRIIRLKRAADLLQNSQLSVSEVAYQVGFNSPRYFSRYFKEYYKELPSEYINKHRKEAKGYEDDFS